MVRPYYQDDAVTIWHGDCREILPQLEPVDLVLTDPPYGINAVLGMGGGTKGNGGMWAKVKIAGDDSLEVRDEALALVRAPFAVFASVRSRPPLNTIATLFWDKGEHVGAGDLRLPWKPHVELIHVGGDGWVSSHRGSAIIRINAVAGCVGNRNDGYRHHPFEKPVELLQRLINWHSGQTIFDPFCGSGTTLRAAKDLGRKAIGIEIEEKYCEIAAKRMSQEVLQFNVKS